MTRAHGPPRTQLCLILLCLMLSGACARATSNTRAAEADDTVVSIRVENQSRENLLVYLGRPGERGMKLGSINALDVRSFRAQQTAPDTEMYLYMMPLTRQAHAQRGYESVPQRLGRSHESHASAPFIAPAGTRIHWTVRDGQRLSAVTLR